MQALEIGLIFLIGLIAFATSKVRHDLVAILMLLACLGLGLVRPESAFAGLGDPVVITVAAVMALSAAIARSGVLRLALAPFRDTLLSEIGIAAVFCILCAIASAFMNNVGALALLLPAALTACRSASVSPSRILMPMAFASLLGGLVTLIGTPPNVIIAEIRQTYVGVPFSMFDFAPVGLAVAIAGVATILLTARFLPRRVSEGGEALLFKVSGYLFEVRAPNPARKPPPTVGELRAMSQDGEGLTVHAIDRGGIIFAAPGDRRRLTPGDVVQLEGRAPNVQAAVSQFGLEIVGGAEGDALSAAVVECVVSARSSLANAPNGRDLLASAGAALIAVSRQGQDIVEGLGRFHIRSGDVILFQAPEGLKADIVDKFALLPLAERAIEVGLRKVDWRPIAILVSAITAAALGVAPLAIALVGAIALLAVIGQMGKKLYLDIDWSIVVLLGAIIPVATAFTDLGAGDEIATWLARTGGGLPPSVVIAAALGATMLVTPLVNNAAAVLIMAPIAAKVGESAGVTVDAMLMAVAVGASCEFLTPIGHQSNTLVMGPGGYRFLDFTCFGAPLCGVVLVVGTLAIHFIWV